MAERILMNEYKALAQEKWVNVEVSTRCVTLDVTIRPDSPNS